MASQHRPSLSRAPISYPVYISTHNLGQHGIRSPSPRSRSPLATPTPPHRAAPTSPTSASSGLLTPPTIDSSPRARHPLADSGEYFGPPSHPTNRGAASNPLSLNDVPSRPKSPLIGYNIIANHKEVRRSPAGSIFSVISDQVLEVGTDIPPIVPRRSSLSNLAVPLEMKSSVNREKIKAPNRHEGLNPRFKAAQEPWNSRSWRIPGCKLVPTASKAFQELCTKQVALSQPGERERATSGSISRRWSSVEPGTHRFVEASSRAPSTLRQNLIFNPRTRRRHARTMSQTAILGEELAKTIRMKLMARKLPVSTTQLPSSITVDHASASDESKATTDTSTDQTGVLKYVITVDEINAIANIIQSTLKGESPPPINKDTQNCFKSSTTFPISRVTSFTSNGLVPKNGVPAQTTVTAAEAHRFSEKFLEGANEFHFPPKPRKRSTQKAVRQSRHEVVWTAERGRLNNEGSFKLQLTSRDSSVPSQKSKTTPNQPSQAFDPKNAIASIHQWSWNLQSKQSSENPSLHEMNSPKQSPPPKVGSVRPNFKRAHLHHNARQRNHSFETLQTLKSHRSESMIRPGTMIDDVVSFPPLPRKLTCDWILPLPDMECTAPPSNGTRESSTSIQPNSSTETRNSSMRSLYNLGIDASILISEPDNTTTGSSPPHPATSPQSPKSIIPLSEDGIDATVIGEHKATKGRTLAFTKPSYFKARPSSPKIKFCPQYEMKRNKSVILHGPTTQTALPRTGSRSTIGSSIGSSSRRKKSVHVAIRDNSLKPSSRPGFWNKVRADSAYPVASSSSSMSSLVGEEDDVHGDGDGSEEDDEEDGILTPTPNRDALLRNRYSHLPAKDHIGIYDAMTGVRRVQTQSQGCVEASCELAGNHKGVHSRNPSVDWIG